MGLPEYDLVLISLSATPAFFAAAPNALPLLASSCCALAALAACVSTPTEINAVSGVSLTLASPRVSTPLPASLDVD